MYVEREGQPGESTLDVCHPTRRVGEGKLRHVCGNDGIENLHHTYKTIIVSLHGYS